MMPARDAENAKTELGRNELIGLIGNAYSREGLSPPSQLYRAAHYWSGLSRREILDILDDHFDRNRQFYLGGSGDGLFHLVQADVRRAIEAKHPRPVPERQPERPQPRRRRVVALPTAGGGPADLLVDDPRAERLSGDRDEGNPTIERDSILRGYEESGDLIEDDEAGA
jgi:hypothetical protein